MANDVAPLRPNRFGAVGQDTPEESERAIGVFRPMRDVEPLEVATVRDRIELRVSAGAGDRRRNQTGIHILMEYDGVLVSSRLIRRIHKELLPLGSRSSHVRSNFYPSTADEIVAVREHVDQVVEPTVAALHAKRREKFVDHARIPAVVLPNAIVIPKELVLSLRRADDGELRATILATHRVVTRTITDQLKIDSVQHALSQTGRGSRQRESRRTFTHGGTGNDLVFGNPSILVPVPFLPCPRSIFLQNVEHVRKLFFPFKRKTKVIHANRRAFQSRLLKNITAGSLSKRNFLRRRDAVTAVSAAGKSVGGNIRPRQTVSESPVKGQNGKGIPHLIGPSVLFDELEPRRRVKGFAINVGADAPGFSDEKLFDVEVRHKSRKAKSLRTGW